MVNKKKEGLSRLFEIAGQKKSLLLLAGLLSAGSAVCMLIPYWAIYRILYELLNHSRELSSIDETNMIRWGWIAFGGLIGGLLLLYASLMSSHVAAYRILYGLRIRLTEHIGRLPLGYLNGTSTGAIKKTMEQNVEKKKKDYKKGYILPVCIFILMMVMLFYGVNSVTNATAQKEQESLKNAVVQSAVHCYSVEGAYPDSLDYLKKHYGITWDESKYKVTYEIIAKNIRPEVKVIPLQESKK